MYIDFHTHAFTESIAKKAINRLMSVSDLTCYTDGSISGTREKLSDWGVEYGVLLPIATKPTQMHTINDWAIKHNHGNLISFGTIHPDAEGCLQELVRIKDAGLKGIKLHPEYQDIYLFQDNLYPVYAKCQELGLMISIHMGFDPLSPQTRYGMPYDLIDIREKFPDLIIIGAHMGGMYNWESVLHYIAGMKNLYLDTGFIAGQMDEELLLKLVKAHGADKVLLASDCPWNKTTQEIEMIKVLPISDEEKEMIFSGNAKRLLGIE